MRNKFINGKIDRLKPILNSSEKWLKNLYTVNEIFDEKKDAKEITKHKVSIDFDFPGWLSKSHLPLDQFIKKSTYEMDFDFKKISNLNNELKMINRKDKRRAFNRYLMQYMNKGSYIFEKNFHKIN